MNTRSSARSTKGDLAGVLLELRAGVDLDCAVNMMVGAFYARYLASSRIPQSFAEELAEIIWQGIAL